MLKTLTAVDSPRIHKGQYKLREVVVYNESEHLQHWQPEWYMR